MADTTEAPEKKIETQKLSEQDTEKAKKKGGLFGDPIFIVE